MFNADPAGRSGPRRTLSGRACNSSSATARFPEALLHGKEQSWLELLLDLQRRGLEKGPQLAIGDGALGFWNLLSVCGPIG